MDPVTGEEVTEPNRIGEMWMKNVCMSVSTLSNFLYIYLENSY